MWARPAEVVLTEIETCLQRKVTLSLLKRAPDFSFKSVSPRHLCLYYFTFASNCFFTSLSRTCSNIGKINGAEKTQFFIRCQKITHLYNYKSTKGNTVSDCRHERHGGINADRPSSLAEFGSSRVPSSLLTHPRVPVSGLGICLSLYAALYYYVFYFLMLTHSKQPI